MDFNNDNFRDMPNGSNLAVMNRYDYHGKKMEAKIGLNAYWDNKIGGQVTTISEESIKAYEVLLDSRHIDVFAKNELTPSHNHR